MSIGSWTTKLTFDEQTDFKLQMDEITEVTKEVEVVVVEKDHANLVNRDRPDSHPISAITNLTKQLDSKMSAGDALTNEEIYHILGGI